VSLPIVRVGGGLLVTANAWRMLNDDAAPADPKPKPVDTWEREVARRAFYPLTFPLTIGPGSISVAITLGARAQRQGAWNTTKLAADIVGVLPVAVGVVLSYRFSSKLIAYLGETGATVFLRLSSFILLCIGVSIIRSGMVDLVRPLLTERR
jgi:multiple antibiotic resistance protein